MVVASWWWFHGGGFMVKYWFHNKIAFTVDPSGLPPPTGDH